MRSKPRCKVRSRVDERQLAAVAVLFALGGFLWAEAASAQGIANLEVVRTVDEEKAPWQFGFFGVVETASGLNADRPSVGSLIQAAPQLKYQEIYRLQLNMGFLWSYLDRAANPWDFTDWSVQLSDLRLVREEKSGLNLSGNLRYYLPLSVDSRNADSRGAVRGLVKVDLPVWRLNFGLNLMGLYRFAKYTTADPARWTDPDKMLSNGMVSFGEGLELGYSPIDRVNIGLSWTFYQHQDYHPGEPYGGSGSSFIADEPRRNDVWEHTWAAGAEVSVNVWKPFHVALGLNSAAPVLQEHRSGVHYNPFDAQAAQVYLDLVAIY